MLLVIHLKKLHIWVHFRQLTYLPKQIIPSTISKIKLYPSGFSK
uniref:Uncharacterized protein n=1 Tax=Rhizophora mucronata TaxID=61149 RepID=A0A2P2MD10_RHIMU